MGAHRGQLTGASNPNWKGGRTIASNGYVLIKVGKEHHLADVRGYAYVVTRAEHGVEHRRGGTAKRLPGEPNPVVACACGCGGMLARYDSLKRERRFIQGHNVRNGADGKWEAS